MNILAIDPGGTTGIAYQADSVGAPLCTLTYTVPEDVWYLSNMVHWDAVICEKFTGAGHMNAVRVYTIELVGGVRAICHTRGTPFVYRTPQNRRAYMDRAKAWLVAQGAPFVDHQQDALAHLLAWDARERLDKWLQSGL